MHNQEDKVCIHQDLFDKIALIMLEMDFINRPASVDQINDIFDKINDHLNAKENDVMKANGFQLH